MFSFRLDKSFTAVRTMLAALPKQDAFGNFFLPHLMRHQTPRESQAPGEVYGREVEVSSLQFHNCVLSATV